MLDAVVIVLLLMLWQKNYDIMTDCSKVFNDRNSTVVPKEGSSVIHFLSPTKELGEAIS